MTEKNNGNGNRTWLMWVIGGLVFIAMAFSGYSLSRVDSLQSAQAAIPEKYVQKTDFQIFADRVEKKLDKIQDLLTRDEK